MGLPAFQSQGALGPLTPNPLALSYQAGNALQSGQSVGQDWQMPTPADPFAGLREQGDTDEQGGTNWAKLIALGLGTVVGGAIGGGRGAVTGLAATTGFLRGQQVEGERQAALSKKASSARKTELVNTAQLFLENEDLDGFKSFIESIESEDPEMAMKFRAVHSGATTKAEKTQNQKIFDHSVAAIKSAIQNGNKEGAMAPLAQLRVVDPGVAKIYEGVINAIQAPGPSTENIELFENAAKGFLERGNVKDAEFYIRSLETAGDQGKLRAKILRDRMNAQINAAITDGFSDPEEQARWNRLDKEEKKKVRLSSEIIEGIDQFRLALLDPRVFNEIGKLPSLARDIDTWVTGGENVSPEIIEARTVLGNAIDLMLRGRTGAAIGEKEEARYRSLFGDVDLSVEGLLARVRGLRGGNLASIKSVLGPTPISRFDFSDRNKGLTDAIDTRSFDQLGRILQNPKTPQFLKQPLQDFLQIEPQQTGLLVQGVRGAIQSGQISREKAAVLVQQAMQGDQTALAALAELQAIVPGATIPSPQSRIKPQPPQSLTSIVTEGGGTPLQGAKFAERRAEDFIQRLGTTEPFLLRGVGQSPEFQALPPDVQEIVALRIREILQG
jgi:hypothetical protein